MFDETPQLANQSDNQAKTVEDIFAATDKAPSATAPVAPSPTPPLGPPSALAQGRLQPTSGAAGTSVPAGQLSGASGLSEHAKRLILMIGGGVVIAAGLFVAWRLWLGGEDESGAPAPVNPIETGRQAIEKSGEVIGNTLENIQQGSMQQALNPFEQSTSSGATAVGSTGSGEGTTAGEDAAASVASDDKTDTDQDGLPDGEEAALGTNSRLVDSDSDGLSDWEEVKVWDTKPLVSDTDNDTYPDGHEVQNGYNPNGAGKLLDFEKAKQKVQ